MIISPSTLFAIFIGGGAGSVARFLVGEGISKISSYGFPLGTLLANLLATALLAFILIYSGEKWGRDSIMIPLLAIGFCGGFSTFSTFSIDTMRLFQEGQTTFAIANILISVLGCIGTGIVIFKTLAK
jgi:CrcB protein|tara:strand:- start:854 stop:1237 length:384 start_codon:yes stop_codon:yes gene_type:complete